MNSISLIPIGTGIFQEDLSKVEIIGIWIIGILRSLFLYAVIMEIIMIFKNRKND